MSVLGIGTQNYSVCSKHSLQSLDYQNTSYLQLHMGNTHILRCVHAADRTHAIWSGCSTAWAPVHHQHRRQPSGASFRHGTACLMGKLTVTALLRAGHVLKRKVDLCLCCAPALMLSSCTRSDHGVLHVLQPDECCSCACPCGVMAWYHLTRLPKLVSFAM